MKIKKYYKWIILGISILLFLLYSNKESFVSQVNNDIYSTTKYENQKSTGDTIISIPNTDKLNCFNKCNEDNNCEGFFFYETDKKCVLKKNLTTQYTSSPGVNTYLKNKRKNSILKYYENTSIDPMDTKSKLIKTYPSLGYTDCYNMCASRNECNAFEMDYDIKYGPGKCSLYSNVKYENIITDPSDNNNFVILKKIN